MDVASGCGEQEVGVASGSGWNLWAWLLGVVLRRYIDFLILLIPTPLVSVLFCSSIYIIESISRDERDAPLTYNYSMAVLILIPGPIVVVYHVHCGGVPCPLWWCTMSIVECVVYAALGACMKIVL